MQAAIAAGVAGMAGLLGAGADPVAVVETYLARIERHRAIGAFVDVDVAGALRAAAASRARQREGAPPRPLEGVTIAVKSNIAVAGLPWTAGIAAYRDRIAREDAAAVARLRAAGAIILGTLAMHEGALGATTDDAGYGRCHNPWRHGHTPGGSSGGSAAAVAAGLCAGALGTDTLGSVRVPSAYCGVFGHKPAYGAIPTSGVVPLSWTLDNVGVHARSAADCAALLEPFGCIGASVRPGTVAALRLDGFTVEPAVADAFAATTERARTAGLEVIEIGLHGVDLDGLRRLALLVIEAEAAVAHAPTLRAAPDGFSAGFRKALAWAEAQSAVQLAAAYRALDEARATLETALAGHAALLTPTTPQHAFAFGAPIPLDQANFTLIASLLRWPATAFPAGLSADGLPLSVQVIAREDATALALADRLAVAPPAPQLL